MPPKSTIIKKSSLSDQIFDYIHGEIVKGTWKPGDKLPSENELSELLGVSRMSLRNGIQRCNAVGLTETRVGEGTFVCDFSMRSYFSNLYNLRLVGKSADEINDLRFLLQIGSIRIAFADGVSDAEIQTIADIFEKMKIAAQQNDMETFHAYDFQFHRSLCMLCKNELLFLLYDAMEYLMDDITRENVVRSVKHSGNYDLVIQHHQTMLDCLWARDLAAFIETMDASRKRSVAYYQDKNVNA